MIQLRIMVCNDTFVNILLKFSLSDVMRADRNFWKIIHFVHEKR